VVVFVANKATIRPRRLATALEALLVGTLVAIGRRLVATIVIRAEEVYHGTFAFELNAAHCTRFKHIIFMVYLVKACSALARFTRGAIARFVRHDEYGG